MTGPATGVPMLRVTATCLLLCAASPAQVVSPSWSISGLCATSTNVFSIGPIARWQQVHSDVQRPGGFTVHEIDWRCRTPGNSATMLFSIQMSTSTVQGAQIGPSFVGNHGPNVTQVMAPRTVVFPAIAPPSAGSLEFNYRIPLDHPFIYPGFGSLVWDMLVQGNALTPAPGVDYWRMQLAQPMKLSN